MASTSKKPVKGSRPPNALEISIHKMALARPKQIASQQDVESVEAPNPGARALAINWLLKTVSLHV